MHYSHTTYTIRDIKAFYDADEYFMKPVWQRDPVWAKKMKPDFIRAISTGVPIPEICLWEREDGVKVTVDGKQRSTAIIEFLEDSYCYDKVWFSGLSEEEMDAFLDIKIGVLLLGPENTESEVVAYYKSRNSTSIKLSAGEILKADVIKPIVVTTNTLFYQRSNQIERAFGIKKAAKRSGDLENTVPYLASSVSNLDNLTKAIRGISDVLSKTTQAQVDAVLPLFESNLDKHIAVCARVVAENPDLSSKWKGFPPLRKVSPIWVSIVTPGSLDDRDPSDFWSTFYKKLRERPELSLTWDNMTRTNANAKKIVSEIEWAKMIVNV